LPIIFWYSICSAVRPAVEPAALPDLQVAAYQMPQEGQQQQQRDQRRLEVE
jgi:hypothetical protein